MCELRPAQRASSLVAWLVVVQPPSLVDSSFMDGGDDVTRPAPPHATNNQRALFFFVCRFFQSDAHLLCKLLKLENQKRVLFIEQLMNDDEQDLLLGIGCKVCRGYA